MKAKQQHKEVVKKLYYTTTADRLDGKLGWLQPPLCV